MSIHDLPAKANLFYSKWVTPEYIYDSGVILANQKSLFTQLATTWFVAKLVWLSVGILTRLESEQYSEEKKKGVS